MEGFVFEPIMKDVIGLVQEQARLAGNRVQAVLLVGGFGQSDYLKQRIQRAVGYNVQVTQPENGWTAVVRGAAILGLSNVSKQDISVAGRVARKSYGTPLQVPYDRRIHNPNEVLVLRTLKVDFEAKPFPAFATRVVIESWTKFNGSLRR